MRRLGHDLPLLLTLAVATCIAGCGNNSTLPDDQVTAPRSHTVAKVLPARDAIAGAHVPALDPHTMAEAEVRRIIGDGSRCEFRYTTVGAAAVGIGPIGDGSALKGVVKLNGNLVALAPVNTAGTTGASRTTQLADDPIRIKVEADAGEGTQPLPGVRRREATMTFEVADALRVDYRGYVDCASKPVRISHRR